MKMKRLCSAACAGILSFSAVILLPVSAEDALIYNGMEYEIHDGSIWICGYTRDLPDDLVIPSEIDGLPVTYIDYSAFGSAKMTSVYIPDSVTSFAFSAFSACTTLTSVRLPEGLETIGSYMFSSCNSLTEIHIPETVTKIGDGAFTGCEKLKEFNIPKGVTKIPVQMMDGCRALTSFVVPDQITTIEWTAFQGCSNLESIVIPENVTLIRKDTFRFCDKLTIYGAAGSYAESYAREMSIPFRVLGEPAETGTCGENLTWAFDALTGALTISGTGDMDNWDSDEVPWKICQVKSVQLSEGITSIGTYAFYDAALLTEITIPASVRRIGIDAFSGCHNLQTVSLPEGLTGIGIAAFSECWKLREITIPDSVTELGMGAFWDCTALESVTLPAGITGIADAVFNQCTALTSVTVPDGVEQIGGGAFGGCSSLTEIVIPARVTNIWPGALAGCPQLTIKGYTGSAAEAYAAEYQIPFVPLGTASAAECGDLNSDGKVGAEDAQMALQAYVNTLAGKPSGLTDAQKAAADITKDGKVDAVDAQIILQYYVNGLAGKVIPWETLVQNTK